MPAPALHLLGTDLQTALYAVPVGSPADFSSFGYRTIDEIWGTDKNGMDTRYGVQLVNDAAPKQLLNVVRGTKYRTEWESDVTAFLIDSTYSPGRVHAGFEGIGKTFRLASGSAIDAVFKLFESVVVMGHSLGGPEATRLASSYGATELICYASPKPGDQAYGAWVRSRVPRITLYENHEDRVPKLPLTIDDPLGRFDFWQVKGTILMDARLCVPPVVIPKSTNPDPIKRAIEDLEIAHSCDQSYKPLISALP